MMQKQEDNRKIERAKSYPFDRPDNSYFFVDGKRLELIEFKANSILDCIVEISNEQQIFGEYLHSEGIESTEDFSNRFMVLACGSNASVEQLKTKFLNFGETVVIPVMKASLYDFDVVYSAHFSSYGSIPATLQYSPGTFVEIFVTYLTKSQLNHMHETERLGTDYIFAELSEIQLILENYRVIDKVFLYLSLHGCLFSNDNYIALSAVHAENRVFPSMNETEILTLVRDFIDRDRDLDRFILKIIENYEFRKEKSNLLKQISKEFSYRGWVDARGRSHEYF